MPGLFWGGRLTPRMKLLVNANNLLAALAGSAFDVSGMKQRMRAGYEGTSSKHIARYDEVGLEHYQKIAGALLEGLSLEGLRVLDVGCGSGIVSRLALERGAGSIVCADTSSFMLQRCGQRLEQMGPGRRRFSLLQLDAEGLPLGDQSFDVVLSSMVLGLVPRPGRFLGELWRVLRPGGALALSTHGHEHYWEAIDAAFRAVPVRMVLGYRLEYWPLKPRRLRRLLEAAGFVEVSTTRLRWQDEHETTLEVLDFFSATSGAWWLSRFAPETATSVEAAMRAYFEARGPRRITQDVVLARGRRAVDKQAG